MTETSRTFEKDYDKYLLYLKNESEINKTQQQINFSKEAFMVDIERILSLLSKHKFLMLNEENKYTLTVKGIIANNIQEVNGICFSELIMASTFDHLLPEQFASILASFTNIRVKEEYKQFKSNYEPVCDYIINSRINGVYEKYYNIELSDIGNVDEQDYETIYDINREVYDWCKAETEEECKKIIGRLYDKEIFVGEFVKALMKINNICSDLERVFEVIGLINLKNMVSKIPSMTLKYIATNQSLYI